jgi:hypothetical protein
VQGLAPRVHQVPDRLGLDQVHLPVQVGPLGELAGTGLPGPPPEASVQDQGGNEHAPVDRHLGRILPGVGGGPGKEGDEPPVKEAAGFRVPDPEEVGTAGRLGGIPFGREGGEKSPGSGPAHPDHRNGSPARGGSQGDDGVARELGGTPLRGVWDSAQAHPSLS